MELNKIYNEECIEGMKKNYKCQFQQVKEDKQDTKTLFV